MELFDWIFIISAIVFFSSIIAVFILTANDKMDNVRIIGIILFVMLLPIILILINYIMTGRDIKLIIYLIFIIIYLVAEFLLDMVLKIDFRSKPSRHVPYIIVEWAACYSFLIGALTLDVTWGWIVAFFFFAFIIALVYNVVKRKKSS